MSMGGLPSRAWADAINALYEAGVVVVTAAGNNYGNAPTHVVVYPARFGRVVAACGVMANGVPYANLLVKRMAGNYGPERQNADRDCGLHPERSVGAVRRADRGRLQRKWHLVLHAADSCSSSSLDREASRRIQRLSRRLDAGRAVRKALFESAARAPRATRRNWGTACSVQRTRFRMRQRRPRNSPKRLPTERILRF